MGGGVVPYVLILFMTSSNGSGGVAMQEFASQLACRHAIEQVKTAGLMNVWGKCVPKNVQQVESLPTSK